MADSAWLDSSWIQTHSQGRSGGRGWGLGWIRSPQGAETWGQKMNILNEKLYFQYFTYFKLPRRIQGNPVNSCDFLTLLISVMGRTLWLLASGRLKAWLSHGYRRPVAVGRNWAVLYPNCGVNYLASVERRAQKLHRSILSCVRRTSWGKVMPHVVVRFVLFRDQWRKVYCVIVLHSLRECLASGQ